MKSKSQIITGNSHSDERGVLYYNNDFDAAAVKRIYFIENKDVNFKRGWQGHKIEQRWFVAVQGSFKISVIVVDDWENPSRNLPKVDFILSSSVLDVLHVPNGCITAIQALQEESRLMAQSDYKLGEVQDEYRFDSSYFK